jgi:hypothetical protein
VWVCGCVGVWVCGCVGVWVCGCVGVWVCGCVCGGAAAPGAPEARRPGGRGERHRQHVEQPPTGSGAHSDTTCAQPDMMAIQRAANIGSATATARAVGTWGPHRPHRKIGAHRSTCSGRSPVCEEEGVVLLRPRAHGWHSHTQKMKQKRKPQGISKRLRARAHRGKRAAEKVVA